MAQFKRSHYEEVAAIIKKLNEKAADAMLDAGGTHSPDHESVRYADGYQTAVNDCMEAFVALFKSESPSFDVFKFVAKAGRK